MEEKKRNLFIVETEYHILNTLAIILDRFIDLTKYENTVIVVKSTRRLSERNSLDSFPYIDRIIIIESEFFTSFVSTKVRTLLKPAISKTIDRFFYFNENRMISTYLINRLSKRKTIICLCQDGLKAYVTKRKAPFYSRLKSTLLMHLELWRNLIPVDKFYLYDSGFGKYLHDDEYWLSYPELFSSNRFNKPVIRINTDTLSKYNSIVEKVFDFPEDIDSLKDCKYFYINQPFSDESTDFECEKVLLPLLNSGKIVIKTHPHTSNYALERYYKTNGISIIRSEIPAEIYIQHLKNVSIISGWSTALLINNQTCRFYWLFPYFKLNVNIINISIPIIPNHIKLVNDIKIIINQASNG
jgi:hypothetical protein